MAKALPRKLDLNSAIELMRQSGHRLMLMHASGLNMGLVYYVVPGGEVSPNDAAKIIERPDVQPFGDGLFPGCSQQWKLG